MRLRRQLLFVSLLTLALPWAGCEYIREMEKTLRQGQQAALQATAQAVAARLASDPQTQRLILWDKPTDAETGHTIYAHPLTSHPIVDGYDDDWRSTGLESQTLSSVDNGTLQIDLLAGKYGDELFLFCRVHDPSLRYYSPVQGLEASDHLQLWLKPPTEPSSAFTVYTGAPGQASVVRAATGEREHRISGAWQEWQQGYQIELRLPLRWAQEQLGLEVADASPNGSHVLRTFPSNTAPPALATRYPSLDEALTVFVGNNGDTLLRLTSSQGWLIAEAGQRVPQAPLHRLDGDRLLTRLYRLALGDQNFPPLDNPRISGRFTSPEVAQALEGTTSARWYRNQGQQVVRVAVPVELDNRAIATVVAEQTTDTLRAMTDSAFSRLVNYSLLAFAGSGLGLLAYASWLSWRIRRLSKAADNAVDSNGRITRSFPQSHSRDEIGDLSRSYHQLLERLHQYNSYLETLASKLSHELRTPLAVVRSSLDNLEHQPLSPEAITYSGRAKEGAERLSRTLTAMSAASRVEQSIRSAELEPVDVQNLLQELTAAYTDVYPQVNWRFSAACDNCTLLASPELLVQMLDKLADNAADFCPAGETVEINLQEVGRSLVLQVSNPGPPLPAHMQGQLFDSLVSIREGQNAGEHLGLGLYIVRLIADFHRGTVAANNRPDGSGAQFKISFPLPDLAQFPDLAQ